MLGNHRGMDNVSWDKGFGALFYTNMVLPASQRDFKLESALWNQQIRVSSVCLQFFHFWVGLSY